jgi:hypothetical protein
MFPDVIAMSARPQLPHGGASGMPDDVCSTDEPDSKAMPGAPVQLMGAF